MKGFSISFNGAVALRIIAALMVVSLFLFLIDNFLIYWFEQPGLRAFLIHIQWIAGDSSLAQDGAKVSAAKIQFFLFLATLIAVFWFCLASSQRRLAQDAQLYSHIAAYIVRAAFWSVFLVGITDMIISFLRVEGLLNSLIGDHLTTQLGRSIYRGSIIHFPLIILSFVIACFSRSLGFIWLALLIVIAEFLIVLTRFVFSYEQAFMGDLVRFWYAGLFLFASAYTLLNDGHVRVDVFYANFSEKSKCIINIFGSLLLGIPLCWNILIQGMASKGSIINSPLLSFEISQSGFGMYTKYLMAGYLIIFAVSMGVQFVSFILQNLSNLNATNSSNESIQGA